MKSTGHSGQARGVAWGLGAALIGSLCCVGPVAAVVLGLGSASFLLGLAAYRPFFLGASFVLMGVGAFIMLRRSRACCSVGQQRRNLWAYLGVTLLAFALSYGLLTYVIPSLAYRGVGEAVTPISVGAQGEGVANLAGGATSPRSLRQAILQIDGMT